MPEDGERLEFAKESEALGKEFHALLEASPDAMVVVNAAGRIVIVNAQVELLFGYERRDLIGQSVDVLVPERFRERHPAHRTGYFAGPKARPMGAGLELLGLRKDGTEFPVDISLNAVESRAGRLVIAAVRDVTLRQKVEAKFRGLLEAAPDAMVIVNSAGRITLVNSQAERLFGYNRTELIGQEIEILVPPRFRHRHPHYRAQYVTAPRPRPMGASLDLYGLRKDGTEFPVEISLSPMEAEDGQLVTAAIRDITDRKRADEARARLAAIVEFSDDAIIGKSLNGTVLSWNKGAERVFGYLASEIVGQPVTRIIPTDRLDEEREILERLKRGEHIAHYETVRQHKTGRSIHVAMTVSPIKDTSGAIIGASKIVRDITEKKALEEQLHRKKEELEEQYQRVQEANRLKSEFLANMSHELRTPLNSIIGFTQLIHDGKAGPTSADQHEYLGDILTSSRHLLQLINDVLDLAKVESGKMEFHHEPVELTTIFTEVRDILRSLSGAKRIPIEIAVTPDVAQVTADSSKLKQVLYNYLSNALKFTPEEGRVTLRAVPEGSDSFRIEVEDTGIGIRDEDRGRLFVEFQQLDASTAKKYQGTGLGLALTKRIVEAQAGRVGVTSRVGAGSTFYAVLPRRFNNRRLDSDPDAVVAGGGPLVLSIEDDADDRKWLSSTLARAGYRVDVAATGTEALTKSRRHRYDAIILDPLLPDISGHELLLAIRATSHNRSTPVIVVTVLRDKAVAIGSQVQDILHKPLERRQLLRSLRDAGLTPDGSHTVLVVDDDPLSLNLADRALRLFGYRPVCASNAAQGLRAVTEVRPSAILLDLLMPDIDGWEFLRRLRSLPDGRRIPVIVWTVKDLSRRERTELMAAGQAVVDTSWGSSALLTEIAAHAGRPSAHLGGTHDGA